MNRSLEDDMPKVTCIMPTYNRLRKRKDGSIDATLLEEALESYLRQTYKNRELIIVNDTPGQILRVPQEIRGEVRVINLEQRMPTLGDKYRYATNLADGEYITPWDDDDIMLPERLERSSQHLQGADVLVIHGLYALQNDNKSFRFDPGSGFAADWYSTSLINRIGYHQSSFGSDAETRRLMINQGNNVKFISPNSDWHFYVYRWSTTGRMHLSGAGRNGYDIIGKIPIHETDYTLQPHWECDYVGMVEAFRGKRSDGENI